MHYLITGHTGFKGAWMSLLLLSRGHTVSGISLPPDPESLFSSARISDLLKYDLTLDIRDKAKLTRAMGEINPDVLIHLAAQPLVRYSYRYPIETFETNVNGTLNILQATQGLSNLKARLVITTDKVYKNFNRKEGYVESEPLGGDDPYSASKAMADLMTQSWVKSFPAAPTAIARAGNVIGGGDVCEDRLIPDIVRAFKAQTPVKLRYPAAVRPWQHVLDCVNGYLSLVDALIEGHGKGEWNFGPDDSSFVCVGDVVNDAIRYWGAGANSEIDDQVQPAEANLLALNSSKAASLLSWENVLKYPESLEWTLNWELLRQSGEDAREITFEEIKRFEGLLQPNL